MTHAEDIDALYQPVFIGHSLTPLPAHSATETGTLYAGTQKLLYVFINTLTSKDPLMHCPGYRAVTVAMFWV